MGTGITNEASFSLLCANGSIVKAERCDFVGGVHVQLKQCPSAEQLAQDIAQAIGYHAINILPHLKGFNGYAMIDITLHGDLRPKT